MKNKLLIGLSVLSGVVLLIMGLFAVYFALDSTQQSTFGGTVISLDKVTFDSNDPTIKGDAFLLTMIQNGASQTAVGDFSASDVNNKLTTEEQVKYGLKINLDNSQQTCTYRLREQDTYVRVATVAKKYDFGLIGTSDEQQKAIDDCISKYGRRCIEHPEDRDCVYFATLTAFSIFNAEGYCIQEQGTGVVGSVDFNKLSFESTISATINNVKYSGKISNDADKSVWLKDGTVQASWVGSLVDGSDCPKASGQGIQAILKNGKWVYTSQNAYYTYLNARSTLLTCLKLVVDNNNRDSIADCLNNYNLQANNAMAAKSFVADGGEVATTSGTTGSGTGKIILSQNIQFPMFTMRVKASTMGIYVPVGKPSITEINSEQFQTGKIGYIVAKVKNAGDVQAGFNLYAECQSPFQASGSQQITLGSGETKTLNIPLTSLVTSSSCSNCKVVAHDLENPSMRDERTVEVCATPKLVCDAGKTRCNGQVKEICDSNGSGWNNVTSDDCKDDDEEDKLACEAAYSTSNPARYWCIFTAWLSNISWFQWISIIMGSIATLFAELLGMQLARDLGKFGRKGQFIWGSIFAFLIGILVYLIWWVSIIVIISYFVIKALFGFGKELVRDRINRR